MRSTNLIAILATELDPDLAALLPLGADEPETLIRLQALRDMRKFQADIASVTEIMRDEAAARQATY
jgi:hypothetical protein